MFGTYQLYFYFCRGELAEWSIAAVLKTVDLSKGPRVRIPHSPPLGNQGQKKSLQIVRLQAFCILNAYNFHTNSDPIGD
jgi:hypothetical protein